jgi:putative ABC transport system permease protein
MSTRLRRRRRPDEDFARELQAHIDIETDRLIAEGLSPESARLAAHRRFGSITMARERFFESGRRLWLDRLGQDVRCATRNARRFPLATAVAVASLAAGIGATTVTLTIRDVVFHKAPPSYQEPRSLSKIQVGAPDRSIMPIGNYVPAPLYSAWRDTLGPSIAAAALDRGPRDLRTDDRTELAPVRAVTPGFFAALGVNPVLGAIPTDLARERTEGTPAILSYRLWQRLFDGRADVIGRTFWIDNVPHTVVAVLPARFWFSSMSSPVWTPFDVRTLPADAQLEVIARRAPGVTAAMLESQLQPGLGEYARHLPANARQLRLKISGVEGTPLGNQMSFVLPYLLGMSVLLTLLIACANVATIMIAQWTAREHEIAIRTSIGASRGRIVRSLLTESLTVAVCGGLLGVAATFALRAWVLQRVGVDTTMFDLSVDRWIFVETTVITLVTGVLSGIAPALYETRRLHANPLRTIAASDRVRQRWRHALVVFEITVTVALLVETAAMVDGYRRIASAQMGFSTAPLLRARLENPRGVPVAQTVEALSRLPGVASVAAATSMPFGGIGPQQHVSADGGDTRAILASRAAITPGFFSALGVPMRAGRAFSRDDDPAGRIAIVNEALVRRLFDGHLSPGRVWMGGVPYDVVGVVADYANRPLEAGDVTPKIFVPLNTLANDVRALNVLVRAHGDPGPLVQTVRRVAQEATAGTIVTGAITFDQFVEIMGQEMLLGTAPLFPLIAIGMLLTTAGIYGTLAFAITRRSQELAVRVAIGASRRDIVGLVASHAVRLVAAGSVAGIGVTFGLSRVVRASGGAGSIYDPPLGAFVVPVLAVVAIGAIAAWVPSRRALRINPATLLKTT